MKPDSRDAYQLVHDGAIALAEVEAAGMRIDIDQLEKTIRDVDGKIDELLSEQRRDEVWKTWKRRFGDKANMGSRHQLAGVLFGEMKYEVKSITKTGKAQVNEEILGEIDLPFAKRFLKVEKLKKLRSTYLIGIKRELVGEFIHPSFNQHLVLSHRSSADSPNVQNQIKRDEEFAEMLRRCFIPRDDHVLVECDYSALEFRVNASFWRDTKMVAYASDPKLDIHRDMASECYMMPMDQVTKQARFFAKNQFVFPRLYGSDYIAISRGLWVAIHTGDLKTSDGVSLKTHLRSQGIKKLGDLDRTRTPRDGTFESRILQVQKKFDRWFPEWKVRKDKWWNLYQERGWFRTMTGFVCSGVYSLNQVMNLPIQGPSYQCLLWSLIRMVRWLKKNKMRSRVVCEIHDSLVADVHRDELDDYMVEVKRVMTEDAREAWPWIITPLSIEADVYKRNWFEKETLAI